jgi:hypothetical protein
MRTAELTAPTGRSAFFAVGSPVILDGEWPRHLLGS